MSLAELPRRDRPQTRPSTSIAPPPAAAFSSTDALPDAGACGCVCPKMRIPAPIAAARMPRPPATSPTTSLSRPESTADCEHECVGAQSEPSLEWSASPERQKYQAAAQPAAPIPNSAIGKTRGRPPAAACSCGAGDGAGGDGEAAVGANVAHQL